MNTEGTVLEEGGLRYVYPHLPGSRAHEAETADGTWHLGHPDADGLVHVRFKEPWPEGMSDDDYVAALRSGDKEAKRRTRRFFAEPLFDQGYFASGEDARALIPGIVAGDGRHGFDPGEHGFEPSTVCPDWAGRTCTHWIREVATGHFLLVQHADGEGRVTEVALTFQGKTQHHWQNLLRLQAVFLREEDGGPIEPCAWPPAMAACFGDVAAAAAMAMMERYRATGRERHRGRTAWNAAHGVGPGRA